jgi:hypothetical protein
MMNDWAKLDPKLCPCQGSGWAEVDLDVFKECPIHLNEETLMNDREQANRLEEQIRRDIRVSQSLIKDLKKQIQQEEGRILDLQMELIGRIPTKNNMSAIKEENKNEKVS